MFWWVWGGWGWFGGVRRVRGGVLGKFLEIFRDLERFLGIWRVWKDLEGSGRILKGDFW